MAPVVGGEPLPVTESGKQQKEGAVLAAVHEDQGIAPQAGRLRFTHVSSNAATTLPSVANPQPRPHTHPHTTSASFLSWLLCTAIGVVDIATAAAAAAAVGVAFNADDGSPGPRHRGGHFRSGGHWSPCTWLQPPRGKEERAKEKRVIYADYYYGGLRVLCVWYRPEPATDENETRRRSSSWSAFEEVDAAAALVTTRVK